jgi:hypothetical protein
VMSQGLGGSTQLQLPINVWPMHDMHRGSHLKAAWVVARRAPRSSSSTDPVGAPWNSSPCCGHQRPHIHFQGRTAQLLPTKVTRFEKPQLRQCHLTCFTPSSASPERLRLATK